MLRPISIKMIFSIYISPFHELSLDVYMVLCGLKIFSVLVMFCIAVNQPTDQGIDNGKKNALMGNMLQLDNVSHVLSWIGIAGDGSIPSQNLPRYQTHELILQRTLMQSVLDRCKSIYHELRALSFPFTPDIALPDTGLF